MVVIGDGIGRLKGNISFIQKLLAEFLLCAGSGDTVINKTGLLSALVKRQFNYTALNRLIIHVHCDESNN